MPVFGVAGTIKNLNIRSSKGYVVTFPAKAMLDKIGKGADAGFLAIAKEMQASMRRRAPVDTGRLRDSITVKTVGRRSPNPRIEVSTVFYGKFVDQGTSRMPPRPFITSVIFAPARKWEKKISKIARAIIKGGK